MEWRAATADGRTYAAHFGPATAPQSPAGQSTTPPTAAMVVDTSVASNACGNCGSANNACQCVNDKAGDISVSCRDQRCINHRYHRPQQKINAYRNGVAILVPAHLPNLRAVQPVPAANPGIRLQCFALPVRQFCGSRTEGSPQTAGSALRSCASGESRKLWQLPSPQHWHSRWQEW